MSLAQHFVSRSRNPVPGQRRALFIRNSVLLSRNFETKSTIPHTFFFIEMSKRPLADEEANSPKKKRAAKDPKPLDPKKFGGKTEEEVCQMLLPDHLAPGLDIIFVSLSEPENTI